MRNECSECGRFTMGTTCATCLRVQRIERQLETFERSVVNLRAELAMLRKPHRMVGEQSVPDAILAFLERGAGSVHTAADVARALTWANPATVAQILSRLAKTGRVAKFGRSFYGFPKKGKTDGEGR